MTDFSHATPIATDALIIGAGPVGLYQVFQLGLQEVHAHVVDALPYAGGQCIELYADKPIYDIPGIAVCTGRELVEKLLQQTKPFAPDFRFNQVVTRLEKQDDGRFLAVTTSTARGGVHPASATAFLAKTVFIAAGVGAFQPRTLKVDGLEVFEGSQLHYAPPDPSQFEGRHIVIAGDGDSALEAALRACPHPDNAATHHAGRVTLVHRRDAFTAQPATLAMFRERLASGHIDFLAGQITGCSAADGTLEALEVLNADGEVHRLLLDQLWVLQGLSPKLGPVAHWGLLLEKRQLSVNTQTFCTSEPGIFAVGDINTYPGKKKLIVCGFHECVLAAFGAMPYIDPDKKVLLQYTTTSSKLHHLLGVKHPGPT
jgi:thioredoxin reductase (NADPH)